MKTLSSLQILRAVAAWMVVYHHYMQGFHDFKFSSAVGDFFSSVGPFGVDIFFVVSGFIMYYTLARKNYTAVQFMLRRMVRILPVYWFMTLAVIPVTYFFPNPDVARNAWSMHSLALSLLFVPHLNPTGIGVYPLLTVGWTLNFEMFFYVWLSLMLLMFRRFWFVACAVSMLCLPTIWNQDWPYSSILSSQLLYEFVIGMFVGSVYLRLESAERLVDQQKGPPIPEILLGGVLLLMGISIYSAHFNGANLFSAASFVCAALVLERQLSGTSALRFIKKLGDMSYSTYLVHVFALKIALYFFSRPQSMLDEFVIISVYTVMTLLFTHLSFRWIETGPVNNALMRALPERSNVSRGT